MTCWRLPFRENDQARIADSTAVAASVPVRIDAAESCGFENGSRSADPVDPTWMPSGGKAASKSAFFQIPH
jgi:hypothetical protein